MRVASRSRVESPPIIDGNHSEINFPNHLSMSKAQLSTENSIMRPSKTVHGTHRQLKLPGKGPSSYNWHLDSQYHRNRKLPWPTLHNWPNLS